MRSRGNAVPEPGAATVLAARAAQPDAVNELVTAYLPLVYNIIGRAVDGHADVDDLVQETMVRALDGLPELREPASFRSWLVVIALRQVRNRYRAAERAPVAAVEPDRVADPDADFVDLTIARLQLADQRRDLLAATRWLGEEDRQLLALWSLETAGRLTRIEVAAGVGLSPQHTAVRVQRMKAQLDASQAVVRALHHSPRCDRLAEVLDHWDGEPSPLWRKRIVRHIRDCGRCADSWSDLAPAEGLLARLPLLPVPAALATRFGRPAGAHATGSACRTTKIGQARHVRQVRPGRVRRLWAHAAAKPITAGVVALAAVGAVVVLPAHPTKVTADAVPIATPHTTSVVPSTTLAPASTTTTPPPTTTTTTTHPATSAAVAPIAAHSTRKGVSTWNFGGVSGALHNVGASWYYDWSDTPGAIGTPAGVEFVPMMWGAGSVTAANLAAAKAQGGELLGFNEPDLSGQADLSVSQALDLWPQLQATGMRLGSPAVATGGDTAGGWLDQFMSGAASRGYRVDFITLHWYGSDFGPAAVGQLKSYLQAVYNRYHKPIWLTEYALMNFGSGAKYPTAAQQSAFVTGSTTMLDSLSYVERYAWFALPAQAAGDTGLYTDANTPTAAGIAYRAAQ
ncbi:MAG TPA: sigma-70 family RNA polymerase sigma factor [Pseudonocardiaceae bacterium]|nr:sigma-70 family RNA polymerase sigma factor [Pseudonocardiaceae bacterium]